MGAGGGDGSETVGLGFQGRRNLGETKKLGASKLRVPKKLPKTSANQSVPLNANGIKGFRKMSQ